jgi:hypothetical protein
MHTSQEENGLCGELLATMRTFMMQHRQKDAQGIANEVMALAMGRGLKDNTSAVVFKIQATGAYAHGCGLVLTCADIC